MLDQFPRNLFRGDARSFATDPQARDVARFAVDNGFDAGFDFATGFGLIRADQAVQAVVTETCPGDFDRDGDVDIVTCRSGSDRLSLRCRSSFSTTG